MIKKDFPIFKTYPDLVYLDSAATTQKPNIVIQAVSDWYTKYNANIHRGLYGLAEQATIYYEQARQTAADFIGAADPSEIIFTKGATEAINLVAAAWGRRNLRSRDRILLSIAEHHANLVPWQELAKEKKLELDFLDIDENGKLMLNDFKQKVAGVKLISLNLISNVLGAINPVEEIIKIAHRQNIPVLLDAAQAVGHLLINVKQLKVDWLVFSGHKVLAPTGTGVLYGRSDRLLEMGVYQTGGDMIKSVSLKTSEYKSYPAKFEAGTQNLAGVFGLSQAIKYLTSLGLDKVRQHSLKLIELALAKLKQMPEVKIYGPGSAVDRGSLLAFTVKDIHPHDIAAFMAKSQICLRAGHHCAQPLHQRLAVPATSRISWHIYNTEDDIEFFVSKLKQLIKLWPTYTVKT